MKLPTPATKGSASRSPQIADQTRNTKNRNGSMRLCGCHGSYESSLPIVHANAAPMAMAAVPTSGPPRRYANTAIPTSAAQFNRATPIGIPAGAPNTLAGSAKASKSSGPGLLRLIPYDWDDDDHVPSSGTC